MPEDRKKYRDVPVSVIIPFYFAEDTIKRALQSIMTLEHNALEIILVNDATPDCEELFDDLQDEYGSILKIIDLKENEGPGKARDIGLEKATGDYVIFLDADDEVLPNKLNHQLPYMIENNVEMLISDIEYYQEGELVRVVSNAGFNYFEDELYYFLATMPQIDSVLFKRQSIVDCGGFKLNVAEEKEFFIRLAANDVTVDYKPGVVARYHADGESYVSDELRYMNKGWSMEQDLQIDFWDEIISMLKNFDNYDSRAGQIIASKYAGEARKWAMYGRWERASQKFDRAIEINPQVKPPGTKVYQHIFNLLGFKGAEYIRKFLNKFRYSAFN